MKFVFANPFYSLGRNVVKGGAVRRSRPQSDDWVPVHYERAICAVL